MLPDIHTSRFPVCAAPPRPPQWLAWCAVTCWFSMFTRLASLRGDVLLSSPRATPLQHARTLLLLGGILAQHLSWVAGFLRSAPQLEGASFRWGRLDTARGAASGGTQAASMPPYRGRARPLRHRVGPRPAPPAHPAAWSCCGCMTPPL